jgi:hypothetical protein
LSQELIQEIEEDLRREKALKLWKEYGKYAVAVAVVVIVATGGFIAWREYENREAMAESNRFFEALGQAQRGDAQAAQLAFARIGREGRPGFAVLARLEDAALKANADRAAGSAEFRAVAADQRVPREIRSLASVMAALATIDSASREEVERSLASLSGADSQWRHLALEIMAAAAVRGGDTARARELYARISDDQTAPQGARARAAEMIQALGGQASGG